MKGKTKVMLKQNVHQSELKEFDVGYIDGYVRGGDDRPYAVVVVGGLIEMVSIYQLEVIAEETP